MANSEVSRLKFNDTTYEIADELARESVGTALTEVASVEAKADAYNTALSGRITNLENSSGAVLVAKTRTAMTDTNKIYVYTGTATTASGVTYTPGHWYYHNGSKWTDGGEYNQNLDAIDATLTQSNKGADAKVTGDRLSAAETSISALRGTINRLRRNLLKGDYCYHDGLLYRCNTEIAAAEAWTSSHWTAVDVMPELNNLKNDLRNRSNHLIEQFQLLPMENDYENGGIRSSDGATTNSNTRIRTGSHSGTADAIIIHTTNLNLKFAVFGYVRAGASTTYYVGLIQSIVPVESDGFLIVPITMGMNYRIICGYIDDSTISVEDEGLLDSIEMYKAYYHPVDAKQILNYTLSDRVVLPGNSFTWEIGTFSTKGHTLDSNNYIRTRYFYPVRPGVSIKLLSTLPENMIARAYFYYYDENESSAFISRSEYTNDKVIVPNGALFMKLDCGYPSELGIKISDGFDIVSDLLFEITNDRFSAFLDKIGFVPIDVDKGFWSNSGTINPNSTAVCSNRVYEFTPGTVLKVRINGDWIYSVKGGDDRDHFNFSYRLVNDSEITIQYKYTGFMFYRKDSEGNIINSEISDFNNDVMLFISSNTKDTSNYVHDTPENLGVLNVINRAYQMSKISYVAEANLPTQVNSTTYPGYVPQGDSVTGVMYSSVRNESLYVPQCVSFDTYMTAIKNPNSYIYTRTEPQPHYNALTYYGSVCSAMVGYCYGIDSVVPTTVSFDTLEGMEPLEWQDPYALKLGDCLNRSDVHIVIVTDIIRNNRGVIQQIEVTEQVNISSHPMTRSVYYTPETIVSKYFNNHYVAYRYKYIYKIPYQATPWVNLDDESGEPVWNTYLSPRRGDKANWRPNETVEIDVTNSEGFSQFKLHKNEELVSTSSLPSSNLISYNNLTYGHYKVCLTDGSIDSDFVYFDIVDTDVVYTVLGNKSVKVQYSSNLGDASSVCFCEAEYSDSDYRATRSFHVLTDYEIDSGECILDAPETGNWLMKVFFKTQFGLYSSDLTLIDVE